MNGIISSTVFLSNEFSRNAATTWRELCDSASTIRAFVRYSAAATSFALSSAHRPVIELLFGELAGKLRQLMPDSLPSSDQ